MKLKALAVIWKSSLGFGSVFCLCTLIYWDLWCKESFKVQLYLWESPLFFPAPPLVETGQGRYVGVRDLLEHLANPLCRINCWSVPSLTTTVCPSTSPTSIVPRRTQLPEGVSVEAALPFRLEAVGNAAGTVLISLSCVMSHASSFTLFLHTMCFSSVFPMFVSFDVSRAIELGGL